MAYNAHFIVSQYISDFKNVERTWKERLFEKPWRPFQKYKQIYSPKILRFEDGYMVSPKTYSLLMKDAFPNTPMGSGPLSWQDYESRN